MNDFRIAKLLAAAFTVTVMVASFLFGIGSANAFESRVNQFESNSGQYGLLAECGHLQRQAKNLIATVKYNLGKYEQIKNIAANPQAPEFVRQSQFEALQIIRRYRDEVRNEQTNLLDNCPADLIHNTYHRLDISFDRLNVQLYLAGLPASNRQTAR